MNPRRDIEIKLTLSEKLRATTELIADPKGKQAVQILLDNEGKYKCPFPEDCNVFPCSDLWCNADCCSNGNAYKFS